MVIFLLCLVLIQMTRILYFFLYLIFENLNFLDHDLEGGRSNQGSTKFKNIIHGGSLYKPLSQYYMVLGRI